MAYLRGNREDLVVDTVVAGKPREFFNDREKAHMVDVQNLFLEKNPFYIDYTEKETDTEYSYYQIIYAMANDRETMNLRIWLDYLWTEHNMNETIQIDEIFDIIKKEIK